MKDMLIRVKHSKCDIHGLAIFEFHYSFTSPMSCIRESQASLSLLFWFLEAIALLVALICLKYLKYFQVCVHVRSFLGSAYHVHV